MYIWIAYIAPSLARIPDNFSYSADILSLDNFYDETVKKFEGDHISKTNFNYSVESSNQNYITIKTLFNVSRMNNDPIFSVARHYYIDPYSGKHIIVPGLDKRYGYLFAPRFLNKNDKFYYWHVNYNEPALLKFIGEDEINGVSVYHYQSKYQADQSNELSYLPDVPEKKGIKTNVNLNIWFEPISGWLVKYQDNATSFFYDKKTGAVVSPWNNFSNRYTESSVINHANYSHYMKWKILITYFSVPILLLLSILFFAFYEYMRVKRPHVFLWIDNNIVIRLFKVDFTHYLTIIMLVLFVASIIYIFDNQIYKKQYLVGISTWNDTLSSNESVRGFKDGLAEYGYIEGKNILFDKKDPNTNIEQQVKIIQGFVRDNVDLIYTLSTTGTLVARGIVKSIPVVFSDVTYPYESNILSNSKDRKCNFVGSRNYILPAEQYYDFDKLFPLTKRLAFVHKKSEIPSTLLFKEYKDMLKNRGVEVVDIAAVDLDDLKVKLNNTSKIDAIFLACDTLIKSGGSQVVISYSKQNKIPSFSCDKESVANGALVGYVADPYITGRIAGRKAALILNGSDPEWLKTVSPERGHLIINIDTANYLGITIPNEMLNHSDEVIKDNKTIYKRKNE